MNYLIDSNSDTLYMVNTVAMLDVTLHPAENFANNHVEPMPELR
jgi:hypothetical protein